MRADRRHEFYSAVYDVLVSVGGALPEERDRFLHYLCDGEAWHEWRFCGSLGHGGKLHHSGGGLCVSCYTEDLTPERAKTLTELQHQIDALVRLEATCG